MATKVESTKPASNEVYDPKAMIDAAAARRKASGYAGAYIGGLLMGTDSVFVPGDPAVWRVTLVLSFPDVGIVGEVGTLDVDAFNSQVLITDSQAKTIERTALDLAQRTPPMAGR